MKKTSKSRAAKTVKTVKRAAHGGEVKERRYTRAPGRGKTSLTHALLGLIAERPEISGYDIMKMFELSMSHYWHALPGQIYPTLEEMARIGLVTHRDVIQIGRPNKRLYKLTPAGERTLVSWLQSPFEHLNIKHPSLLRARFLGNLGADGAREILAEERGRWEYDLKLYRDLERDYFSGDKAKSNVNAMFSWFTLKRGISWMEESINWCDWAMDQIEQNRELFPAVDMRAGLKPLIPYDPARYFPPRVSYAESLRRSAQEEASKEGK